jgi:hypothetical protein
MSLEAYGLIVSLVSVAQAAQSGDNWSADEATYPSGLDRVDPSLCQTEPFDTPFASFAYDIIDLVGDGSETRAWIQFNLRGELGEFRGKDGESSPVMANCNVYLHTFDSPTRALDAFSMAADVHPTNVGTADDPKIKYHVHGRFDPASFGDVDYDVEMTLDRLGQLTVTSKHLNDTGFFSTATVEQAEYAGFRLTLLQHY